MATAAQQLIERARLTAPPVPYDWERVTHRLGTAVPHDYRELLDAGGGGLWLGFLRLHVPAGPKHVDLERSTLEWEQLQDLFEDEVVGRPDDLAPGDRLLPWASTGTGVTLYWQISPQAYAIRISDRNGDLWERYDLPTTGLLLGIVQGELHSELLTESWMRRDTLFTPYADE
ncbi:MULTISPECIES: hypothetical protein [Nonomuraea]|uniref:SMI1/KNR4 family protein n=1 Tax=Nonomuraea salmonea TaxID=46181 RepID=A0ABV5NV27_9ACTN